MISRCHIFNFTQLRWDLHAPLVPSNSREVWQSPQSYLKSLKTSNCSHIPHLTYINEFNVDEKFGCWEPWCGCVTFYLGVLYQPQTGVVLIVLLQLEPIQTLQLYYAFQGITLTVKWLELWNGWWTDHSILSVVFNKLLIQIFYFAPLPFLLFAC